MLNQIYKALDLYKLTSRWTKNKEYFAYTDSRKEYAIMWYIINTSVLQQRAINEMLQYNSDTDITGRIIKNNYVVWLFDIKNKSIVEGTFLFWETQDILKNFHQKISQPRYSEYFEDKLIDTISDISESIDFWDIWEIEINKKEMSHLNDYTTDNLKWNYTKSREFLNIVNTLPLSERIKKMSEITTSLNTYEDALEKWDISDEMLLEISKLDFWGALSLQEKALEVQAERQRLKNISKEAKRDREEVLQSIG